jgi:hypothetical protein
MYDGCLFMALLISLKLKVTMGHGDSSDDGTGGLDMKKKETIKALRQLVSPSAIIFFGLIFNGGLLWGVHDTYLHLYLQEYLGASSQMLGK